MTHASESLHWYTRSGETAYTVKSRDGTERNTTLRDARKLNLVPSVTSIIQCAAKPGLEFWKQNQVLLAAMTLPRREEETETDYIRRILEDSRAQAKMASERGTAIHASLQAFYQQEPWGEHQQHVIGANEAINAHFGIMKWDAERSFASRLGFGGKVDLSSYEMDCGHVIDFKTKEFGPNDELKTWDEHAMQLAAYREGLGYPDASCAIVYVSATVPGLSRLIEISHEDLAKGWKCFESLLQFWKASKGYDSSFERKAA